MMPSSLYAGMMTETAGSKWLAGASFLKRESSTTAKTATKNTKSTKKTAIPNCMTTSMNGQKGRVLVFKHFPFIERGCQLKENGKWGAFFVNGAEIALSDAGGDAPYGKAPHVILRQRRVSRRP